MHTVSSVLSYSTHVNWSADKRTSHENGKFIKQAALKVDTSDLKAAGVIITARTSSIYARAVSGVVILSVCPSHACIMTKLNNALRIF